MYLRPIGPPLSMRYGCRPLILLLLEVGPQAGCGLQASHDPGGVAYQPVFAWARRSSRPRKMFFRPEKISRTEKDDLPARENLPDRER